MSNSLDDPIQKKIRYIDLLNCAAKMFIEYGYETVTLDSIIAQVGGSKRNIYKYFDDKEGLFRRAIEYRCEYLGKKIINFDFSEYDEKLALYEFGKFVLSISLEKETLSIHRLMINEGKKFPFISQIIYENGHNKAISLLNKWIIAKQQSGFLKENQPSIVLSHLFINSLVTESQYLYLIGIKSAVPSEEEVSQATKIVVDHFFYGCKL